MIPQLWGEDLPAVLKWIREFLVWQGKAQGVSETVGSAESVGTARVYFGSSVPDGWLALDGSYVFITEAPDLFALLGPTPGSPPNMFKLPDTPSALASGLWIIKR